MGGIHTVNLNVNLRWHNIFFQGEAIMFAPARGDTFDKFVKLVEDKFETEVQENYDEVVWDLHCKVGDSF